MEDVQSSDWGIRREDEVYILRCEETGRDHTGSWGRWTTWYTVSDRSQMETQKLCTRSALYKGNINDKQQLRAMKIEPVVLWGVYGSLWRYSKAKIWHCGKSAQRFIRVPNEYSLSYYILADLNLSKVIVWVFNYKYTDARACCRNNR